MWLKTNFKFTKKYAQHITRIYFYTDKTINKSHFKCLCGIFKLNKYINKKEILKGHTIISFDQKYCCVV